MPACCQGDTASQMHEWCEIYLMECMVSVPFMKRSQACSCTTTPPVGETPPTGIESFQAVSAASVCVYGYVIAITLAGPDSVLRPMKLVVSLCYKVPISRTCCVTCTVTDFPLTLIYGYTQELLSR
jgi:hypothetical protein